MKAFRQHFRFLFGSFSVDVDSLSSRHHSFSFSFKVVDFLFSQCIIFAEHSWFSLQTFFSFFFSRRRSFFNYIYIFFFFCVAVNEKSSSARQRLFFFRYFFKVNFKVIIFFDCCVLGFTCCNLGLDSRSCVVFVFDKNT